MSLIGESKGGAGGGNAGIKSTFISMPEMYQGGNKIPAAEATVGSTVTSGQFRARRFDDTIDEVMLFTWLVPEKYDDTAGISFIPAWAPEGTNTGNVQWELRGLPYEDGDVIDAPIPGAALQSVDAGAGTTRVLQYGPEPARAYTSSNQFVPGGLSMMYIFRRAVGGAGDTFTGDAWLIGIELIWTETD